MAVSLLRGDRSLAAPTTAASASMKGDRGQEVAARLLHVLAPVVRRGYLNPLTSALPLLLSTSLDAAPEVWCARPLLRPTSGRTYYILYRPALLSPDLYGVLFGDRVRMEVLECGFLGPGVTQLTVAEFAAVEEWEERVQWRLVAQDPGPALALLSLHGSPVYTGRVFPGGTRQYTFDSPLADDLAPVAVARCPLDDPAVVVGNRVALLTLQALAAHMGAAQRGRLVTRPVSAQRRRFEAALLMGTLVAALDLRLGRRPPVGTPRVALVPAGYRPLLLGWVERDNVEQECKQTQLAASYEAEMELERRLGPANNFVIGWLGPDRPSSTMCSASLAELVRWLGQSTSPALHRFLADLERHTLMPRNADRSEFFSAQSDLTAVYRAALVQELLWALKGCLAGPEPPPPGPAAAGPASLPPPPPPPLGGTATPMHTGSSSAVLGEGPAAAAPRGLDPHSQRFAGAVVPLLGRLQARFNDRRLDQGDREVALTGLQWVAAWTGHFTCYSLLWKHTRDDPATAAVFALGFEASRVEPRLAGLLGLVQLFQRDGLPCPLEEAGAGGPAARILGTALLHDTYYQPYVHDIPLPADPASPLYTPMTTQRWYRELDAECLEVPVNPELVVDEALEAEAEQEPFLTAFRAAAFCNGPGVDSAVAYTAARCWTDAFQQFRRQALGARALPAGQSLLFGARTTDMLRRAAAAVTEQSRRYATEDQLNDWRCECVLATWIYRCYSTLRALLEMQFGLVFQPLVSEIHLVGCRHIDITSPQNFYTIMQSNTMQWAVLPRYNYATGESHLHILFRGTEGFMDIVRDMTAASGTLHVIEGARGYSIAVVNEWYVPLHVELLSIKQAMHTACRYLHLVHRTRRQGTPEVMMHFTGHSLGGAYATILAWMYTLEEPQFSPEELQQWGIRDFRLVTFGQPPVASRPSLEFLKAEPKSRAVFDEFASKTTRVVRRLDPVPRPATAATELTALLRLAQWHSNYDVAAANFSMFGHCGDLVVLSADWDEASRAELTRAMLLDDKQWEASIHRLKDVKLGPQAGVVGDMLQQGLLKLNEFHDHSILMYMDDLANATAGTEQQRVDLGHEYVLPDFIHLPSETDGP